MMASNEIILLILLILIALVGFNIYLNLKKTNDEDESENENEFFTQITDALSNQETNLETQKNEISKLSLGLSEFNYPLNQIRRYLSGGPLAGKFGEWGAESIISDIIPSSKIKWNHEIIKGSGKTVEFAIELDNGLLPIDAKFPSSYYDDYIQAAENEDPNSRSRKEQINKAENAIKRRVKDDAKDINEKYMQKGVTIDFGIMFIPSESLMQLIDRLEDGRTLIKQQIFKDHRVLIIGPNSLAAFLITLNMGFKSVALNERAEEILVRFGKLEKEFREFEKWAEKINNQTRILHETVDSEARIKKMNKVIIAMEELSEDEE